MMVVNRPEEKPKNKKGSWIIGLFIVIFGCSMSCLTLYLFNYTYHNPAKRLSITLLQNDKCGPGFDTLVEQVEWTGKKELTAIVSFEDWCEITGWQGDYQIEGNNLTLQYYTDGWSASGCICQYKLKFVIRGLEKKDYQVTIGNVEK